MNLKNPHCHPGSKLNSFVDYCLSHPNERFWQALRNWSGASRICKVIGTVPLDELPDGVEDTFYIEDEEGR